LILRYFKAITGQNYNIKTRLNLVLLVNYGRKGGIKSAPDVRDAAAEAEEEVVGGAGHGAAHQFESRRGIGAAGDALLLSGNFGVHEPPKHMTHMTHFYYQVSGNLWGI
jgi:hypothetical protein